MPMEEPDTVRAAKHPRIIGPDGEEYGFEQPDFDEDDQRILDEVLRRIAEERSAEERSLSPMSEPPAEKPAEKPDEKG
jgi:hypothetical protein